MWLFFRVEGDECDSGFFVISQVLMNFESFIVFEKIWGIRSSGPKILSQLCKNSSIYREKEWTCFQQPALQNNKIIGNVKVHVGGLLAVGVQKM